MVVNENAGGLIPRGVPLSIASMDWASPSLLPRLGITGPV